MPATKKATKKATAKKVVGKKSAASAPIVKTQIIKSAKSGEIVSKGFAKRNPDTTMSLTVERPLAGAAKKAHDKSERKPAQKKTVANRASAPAKKVAAKKTAHKAPAAKKSAPAKKATAKKTTRGHATVSEIAQVAKPIAKAIVNAVHVAAVKETHGAATKKHAAPARTSHSAQRTGPVTASQQLRSIGNQSFGGGPRPSAPTQSAKPTNSPFNPEAVREVVSRGDLHRPLIEGAVGVFR